MDPLKLNIQFFSQDRVLGSSVKIAFYGPNGPVDFMEADSFKPDRQSSQKKYQPLGQVGQRTQDIFEGWEFEVSGAVVDHSYDDIIYQIDQAAQNGQKNMRFRVTETTTYYDGSKETWVYPDSVLYGFGKDAKSAAEEVTWSFKGSSQTRTKG